MERLVSLAEEVEQIFRQEPSLIRASFTSFLVVGDTHGDVTSSKKALQIADEYSCPVVFLGDYVDRGPYQLENLETLFERKISSPETCLLLRGNHETLTMNTYYGFLDTAAKRYGVKAYRSFLRAFTMMPYALVNRDGVLCVHGGLPDGLKDLSQLEKIQRGQEDLDDPLAMQLLWNDPRENLKGFAESDRGGGALYFGEDVFREFMDRNGLRLMVRSHEPQPEGYRFMFGRKLLTVFSCRYYNIPPKAAIITREGVELIGLG
ncbi:MAG: metallophosphoesterase [Candidatus Caldarchaeum sp.]